jgi:hypothetical protein
LEELVDRSFGEDADIAAVLEPLGEDLDVVIVGDAVGPIPAVRAVLNHASCDDHVVKVADRPKHQQVSGQAMTNAFSRRKLLLKSLQLGSGLTALSVSASARAYRANEKRNIALIGCGTSDGGA